uniref:Phytocyanin domain-containing protein n=1 Tax=Lotus japonicus TaxID=34305 RepID=I3SXN9_LOTJA|nr:unknown [Lotus japonicus]
MANVLNHNWFFSVFLLILLLQIQTKVLCFQYKVGDLACWGLPTSANSQLYGKWSKYHNLTLGDSLLFLYPPSQDSVIQVTEESFKNCNIKNPILFMSNGNSLFNITTSKGDFYFTSGVAGHCQKNQKLHVSVGGGGGGGGVDAAAGPSSLNAFAPSYQTAFGNIPVAPSTSSASCHLTSTFQVLTIGSVIGALFSAFM